MNQHLVTASPLIAALVLACDAGQPAAPDAAPSFSHRGSNSYEYTFQGDVTTDPATGIGYPNVTPHDVVMDGGEPGEKVIFADGFADQVDASGSCFTRSGASTVPVDFAGVIVVDRKNDTKATAIFYFRGRAQDGSTEIKYKLTLNGTVAPNTFPSNPGETTVVTWTGASMGTEGKSKGACTGAMSVSSSVSVTGVN